jgi:hypothetical protein
MVLSHKGFNAWISVDGKTLDEFQTSVNKEENLVTCYLPAEPGKVGFRTFILTRTPFNLC